MRLAENFIIFSLQDDNKFNNTGEQMLDPIYHMTLV